jgi:hypothetical protein
MNVSQDALKKLPGGRAVKKRFSGLALRLHVITK